MGEGRDREVRDDGEGGRRDLRETRGAGGCWGGAGIRDERETSGRVPYGGGAHVTYMATWRNRDPAAPVCLPATCRANLKALSFILLVTM